MAPWVVPRPGRAFSEFVEQDLARLILGQDHGAVDLDAVGL